MALALLFAAAARPEPHVPGEPVPVQVYALRRRRRARALRRCRRLRGIAPAQRAVWLLEDLARLGLVGVVGVATGAGVWPVVAAGLPLLLREAALGAVLGLGQVWLLPLVVPLYRLARWAPSLVFLTVVVGALQGDQAAADLLVSGAPVVGCMARPSASVEVAGGQALIRTEGTVVITLPAGSVQDERVAMVLCRYVRDKDGRPLLTHQGIATAFGKKHAEDTSNRVQRFKKAGCSFARMILDAAGGRPSSLHPEVRALLIAYWERNPLATHEETCRWLKTQNLPPAVSVPSPADLQAIDHLPGNLVLAHNAIARLLRRRGRVLTFALRPLFRHLLQVVDDQDRRLHDAGVEPAPLSGAVEVALGATRDRAVRWSKTGRALMTSLQALVRSPSPEQDEELAAAVGAEHLSPLHWGLLYCTLQISMGQVGALVGQHKSTVCRGLHRLARCIDLLDPFPPAARFSGVLALDEKWVLIPKSFSKAERAEGKKWRYVHFAVDAHSGDLLHVDVFEASDGQSVRAFLVAVRARGIRPRAVVTDMLGAYDEAIRETFGKRVVHHFCRFHHLQAVRHRLRERCGKDWNKHALLNRLVERVDHVYRCKTRRTARRRLDKVLDLREELARQHPEALPVLDIIDKRYPKVVNAIGRDDIPSTNNVTERAIKALNRHYKHMAGFESLDTARHQVALFRFFYRLTPMREAKLPEHRGLSPLDRAGWCTRGVPVADFVRRFTTAWDEDGPDVFVTPAVRTAPTTRPRPGPAPAESETAAA